MSRPNDAVSSSSTKTSQARLIGGISFVAVLAIIVQPRSAPVWLAILASCILVSSGAETRFARASMPPLAWAMLVFCAYCLINSLWAVDRLEALGKVGSLVLIAAVVHVSIAALQELSSDRLAAIGRAVATAAMVGTAFLAIEVVFDQPIMRAIYDISPILRGSPKHVRVGADGSVASIGLYVLNRNLAALDLVVWPVLAMLGVLLSPARALAAGAAIIAALSLAIYPSEHETSKLALPLALLVFVIARLSWRVSLGLLTAGWVAATLLVVPLTLAAFAHNLHQAHWLPETGRNRIILWGYTADQWRKAPVLGIGVASTKDIDDKHAATAVKPDGFTYPLRTGRHAHNIYMQTWYELGAVGAVLLLGVGLAALASIRRLDERLRPYAMASFTMAAVLGAFSWGLWQIWFLTVFGLGVLLIALADKMHQRAAL